MTMTVSQVITSAKQNNLEGRELLDKFCFFDLLQIYNGIGPDRFPEKLRALVTEINEIFSPAALIHDLEYYIGGTREDFTAANDRFRRNCYTLAKAAYGWYDPRRYYWLFKAWRFAGYCEQFGWEGFHKTGEECRCSRCATAIATAIEAHDQTYNLTQGE